MFEGNINKGSEERREEKNHESPSQHHETKGCRENADAGESEGIVIPERPELKAKNLG